jgi:hypothetical protein
VSSTSIWVPISAAFAALFGAGLGAMLQGRYGVSGWRRQIRLEAYTEFLNATQHFNDLMYKAMKTINEANFEERWQEISEAGSRIRRAGTVVAIAGPRSLEDRLHELVRYTRNISEDAEDRDNCIAIARGWTRKDPSYQAIIWRQSASHFQHAAQKILKTD